MLNFLTNLCQCDNLYEKNTTVMNAQGYSYVLIEYFGHLM